MGNVDQFLVAHTQSGLLHGETILGMGLLRHPIRFNVTGVPQHYTSYFGVATDRRLIVFPTDVGGILTPSAKPIAREPIVWWYDELASVRVSGVEGLVVHSGGAGSAVALIPHPGCGPLVDENADDPRAVVARRYDVYRAIDNLESQGAFFKDFPGWIQRQVAARAFPMSPQRRAEVEARLAARTAARAARAAAEAERRRRQQAETAELFRVWGPRAVRAAIGVVLLGLAVWGVVIAGFGWETYDIYSRHAEHDQKIAQLKQDLGWTRAGRQPPADCPEKAAGSYSDVCHGCKKLDYGESPEKGWREVKRADGNRWCPPASWIESEIRKMEHGLEHRADEATMGIVRFVLGGLLAMTALGGGLALSLWDAKRRRRTASAASAPAQLVTAQ